MIVPFDAEDDLESTNQVRENNPPEENKEKNAASVKKQTIPVFSVNEAPTVSSSLFGYSQKITEEEKQRRLAALQKANPKILSRIPEDLIYHPKIAAAIKYYDTNHNGELDAEEIMHIVQDLNKRKDQITWMKSIIFVVLVALIILLVANTFLTMWVIQLTKDIKVEDGSSLTNKNGVMVKTDKPRYYTTISDITSLPASALNAMSRLSFTTADGGVHNYEVEGVRMDASNQDSYFIFFTPFKEIRINNGTALLHTVNPETGNVYEVNVVTDSASSSTTRRLEAMKDFYTNSVSYERFLERCSPDSGVCYHTYDEMMNLHRSGIFSHRYLTDSNSINYVEVSADASILAKDSRSSLTLATDFLENILGSYANVHNGTLSIYFTMKERCSNYDSLAEDCQRNGAPATNSEVDYSAYVPPLRGLTADNYLWWFVDEIQYNKDAYTIQLKVRYAHDQLHDNRLHVVMISRDDPSKIVTYDEVTTMIDPTDPTFTLAVPTTFITNYQKLDSLSGEDSVGDVTETRRKLTREDAENVFHEHLRTKISGFPNLFVSEDLLHPDILPTVDMNNPNFYRRLTTTQSVSFEGEATSKGLHCIANLASNVSVNSTLLLNSTMYASLTSNSSYSNYTTSNDQYVPCQSSINVTDMIAPKAIFLPPVVSTTAGLIQWPQLSDIYDVEEFNNIEIPQRSQLSYLQSARMVNTTSNITDYLSNRKLAIMLEMEESKRPQFISKVHRILENAQTRRLEVKGHFDRLDEAFDQIITHLKQPLPQTVRRQLSSSSSSSTKVTRATLMQEVVNFLKDKTNRERFKKIKELYGNAITMTTLPDQPDMVAYSVRKNNTCAVFRTQWNAILDRILYYNDIMDRINLYSSAIENSIDAVEKVETTLSLLDSLKTYMSPIIPLASKIPYVGPLIKAFYNSFVKSMLTVVSKVDGKLKTIKKKIDDAKIKEKAKKIADFTDKVVTKVGYVGTGYSIVVTGLMVSDKFCPNWTDSAKRFIDYNQTYTGKICYNLTSLIAPIISELDSLKADYNRVLSSLSSIGDFIDGLIDFQLNFDLDIMDTLRSIFQKIHEFLYKEISICIPIIPCVKTVVSCFNVQYPCGVIWCWYGPCGLNWCSTYSCITFYIPNLCDACFTFSIGDILDAVLGVLEEVEDLLESALTKLASLLNITIPEFTLPSLPNFGILSSIENLMQDLADVFPDLDLNFDVVFDLLSNALSNLSWPKC